MAKTTDMATVSSTKAQAPIMISMDPMSVNATYSTTRRRHEVLPAVDHSDSLQGTHV